MKKHLRFSLFFVLALCSAGFAGAQVIIIANPSIKVAEVAKSDLKDLFTGGSASLGGGHATPVLLKTGATTAAFLSEYIGKDDTAFRASWRNLVFSGSATMPKTLDSDAAVVEYVAGNAGAVGYISKASPHEGVKVIAVQ